MQAVAHAFVDLHREFEIFEHRMRFEHGGFLKFAADAGVGDFRFRQAREIDVLPKKCRAGVGAGLAGDHVHHGGFAGAVGADDAAQFAGFDHEAQVVQRLEAVETDRDVFEIENRAVREIDRAGLD